MRFEEEMSAVLRGEVIPLWAVSALLAVGALKLSTVLLAVLRFVWVYFLRPAKNLTRYGKWAIVTGCTDGIGKAIAEEFAAKGLNLVLISRTQAKLEEQAKELQSKFKIDTRVITLDFSTQDTSVFHRVKEQIKELDVGVLVNNVGMAYDHAEYFHCLTQEKIENLIKLNVVSTTHMTYAVLPGMLQRKRGAIINISSASSVVDEPLYAVYSGTKAFVNSFSKALHNEYKNQGIHVQSQLPAFVTTKLSKLRSTSFFICSPRAYAKAFLSKVGYEPVIFSYWTHALQFYGVVMKLPDWILNKIVLSRGLAIRKKAYAKKQIKQQ